MVTSRPLAFGVLTFQALAYPELRSDAEFAEKIRAKPLKLFAHQKADLAGILFLSKSDLQIAPGEATVVG